MLQSSPPRPASSSPSPACHVARRSASAAAPVTPAQSPASSPLETGARDVEGARDAVAPDSSPLETLSPFRSSPPPLSGRSHGATRYAAHCAHRINMRAHEVLVLNRKGSFGSVDRGAKIGVGIKGGLQLAT